MANITIRRIDTMLVKEMSLCKENHFIFKKYVMYEF